MGDHQLLVNGPSSSEFELGAVGGEGERKPFVYHAPVIDIGSDKSEILLRYDSVFRALVHSGWEMNGNSETNSLVDWSMCFGYRGKDYFEYMRSQLNFSMLRCALFIVASMAAYVNPPNLGDSITSNYFMIVTGFAAVANLCCIVAYTMFSVMINRPYSVIDAMVARVRNNIVYVVGIIFDCLGMLSLLVALLLARTGTAGSVAQPMAVILFILVVTTWTWAVRYTDEMQTRKVKQFFNAFLEPHTGMLREEAMALIYRPADLASLLLGIGQAHHLEVFQGFDIDAVLLMEKADLMDLFNVNNDKSRPESRTARLLLLSEIRLIYEEIVRVRKLSHRG